MQAFGASREHIFAIFEPGTGIRRYYSDLTPGVALPSWDVQRAGLRIVAAVRRPVRVYDLRGRRQLAWRASFLGGSQVIVVRDLRLIDPFRDPGGSGVRELHGDQAPLSPPPDALVVQVVHPGSFRVRFPLDIQWHEQDVRTATFRVPGAPSTVRAEYRFARSGQLIRDEVPLTGGGRAEEHLGSLRVAVVRAEEPGQDFFQLTGEGAQAFRLVAPDAVVRRVLPGGFTLLERATGIRRHYDAGRVLTYRDLPVQVGQPGYLRVGVGAWENARYVADANGAPLRGWHVEPHLAGRVLLRPTLWDNLPQEALGEHGRPLTRIVLDPESGQVVEEVLGIHRGQGRELLRPLLYWSIDYTAGEARSLNAAGAVVQEAVLDTSRGTTALAFGREWVFRRSEWRMPTAADVAQASSTAGAHVPDSAPVNIQLWRIDRIEITGPQGPEAHVAQEPEAHVPDMPRESHADVRGRRRVERAQLLQDARRAVEEYSHMVTAEASPAPRKIDGFVVSRQDDGRHVGRHVATHIRSGLRTMFEVVGGEHQWVLRDLRVISAAMDVDQLRVVVTREPWREGLLYGLAGESALMARYDSAAVEAGTSAAGAAFVIRDEAAGHRYYFDIAGTEVMRDVWVGDEGEPGGLGYLRYYSGQPLGTLPRLVDEDGRPLETLRVMRIDQRRLQLRATDPVRGISQERLVVGADNGRLLSEIIARPPKKRLFGIGGSNGKRYWSIDYENKEISKLSASCEVLVTWEGVRFASGHGYLTVSMSETTGRERTLFTRPALGARLGAEDYAGETVLPWLTGRGTSMRSLLFGRPHAYMWPGENSQGWVRVAPVEGRLALVDNEDEVAEVAAEFTRDERGLLVRVPMPGAPGAAMVEYQFDGRGLLVRQAWPVPMTGEQVPPGSLRVVLDRDPFQGTTTMPVWLRRLSGPDHVVRQFRLGPVPAVLRRELDARQAVLPGHRMSDLFTITERDTGVRTYHSHLAPGQSLQVRDLPLDGTGMRVVARRQSAEGAAIVTNDSGSVWLRSWRAQELGANWIAVTRDFSHPLLLGGPIVPDIPMLLHTDSLRVERGSEYTKDAQGEVTVAFATPGAPEGVTTEFRFVREGWLIGSDQPLTGGGSAEERLRCLRVVEEIAWELVEAGDRLVMDRWMTWELRGEDARLFHFGTLATAETGYAPGILESFTVTEERSGIRRHYGPVATLAYRDLPLWQHSYLRVGVGDRAGELRVVGADGKRLADWQAKQLEDGLVAVAPVQEGLLTKFTLDPQDGRLVEDVVPVPTQDGSAPTRYWRIDHTSRPRRAVQFDTSGAGSSRGLPEATLRTSENSWLVVSEGQVVYDRFRLKEVPDPARDRPDRADAPASNTEIHESDGSDESDESDESDGSDGSSVLDEIDPEPGPDHQHRV
ncbi:MAG: hypothetical protein JO362_20505, partial [Streptomycetaceae bacterium]|nr:hypothetical protein [Streptomycetaceae bacterium]